MFEILSQFVERECSPGCIEWYGDDGRTIERNGVDVFVRDEMQAIYDWWNITYNKEYPERLSEIEERLDAFMPDSEFQETESPHLLEWNPSWNSSEVQESYESSLKEMQALNSRADRERIEFMHRLVEISPYMWT